MHQSESKGQFFTFCKFKSKQYVVQVLQGTYKYLSPGCSKQNFVQVSARRDFPSYVKQAKYSAFIHGIATFVGSSSSTSEEQAVFLQSFFFSFLKKKLFSCSHWKQMWYSR